MIYEQYPTPETLSRQDISYAIVPVGETPYAECRSDKSELVIPLNGSEIINSVAEKIPTLAILITGRPLVLEPKLLEKVDALIAAWLPGSEGAGIADVIFGDHDFMGKLPITWFRRVDQLPMNHGDSFYDPLSPLGFGLTYDDGKSKSLD